MKTTGRACKNCLLALVFLNILTQGMLFSGLVLSPYRYWETLILLEGIILLVEALGYWLVGRTDERPLSFSSAFFLSLTLNSASFLIGLLLPF
ncbi:hypothetical protein KQH61_04610 [bacterium]|nr:hypothetical protein [bacterium]MCB2179186.1 hypothetical protein [bacterium]